MRKHLHGKKTKMMSRVHHLHFIGVGGAGMSGIAEVLWNLGYQVSGSDLREGGATRHLSSLGIDVAFGHDASRVDACDAVVFSSAIAEDNPELAAARARRIPVLPRAEMLAELMRFRQGIAVAGTHGKTTITSLLASILAEGGFDPTYVIGGLLNSSGSNAYLGGGEYLVAEADESDASLLRLQPVIAVLSNIDADHLGNYDGDPEALRTHFVEFLRRLPFYGLAVVCLDDAGARGVIKRVSRPLKTYGFDGDADYVAYDARYRGQRSWFRVRHAGGASWPRIRLDLPGRHNVLNALAAIAVAREIGVGEQAIVTALANFQGIGRRCQVLGELSFGDRKTLLIDDYAHHPREIDATLQAVRRGWPRRRVLVVFQPHRYTRTRDLFEDFCGVLSTTDGLLLLDVYAAGEPALPHADSRALCRAIRQRGRVDPVFVERREDLPSLLDNMVEDGDVLLVLGAGDVSAVAPLLRRRCGLQCIESDAATAAGGGGDS